MGLGMGLVGVGVGVGVGVRVRVRVGLRAGGRVSGTCLRCLGTVSIGVRSATKGFLRVRVRVRIRLRFGSVPAGPRKGVEPSQAPCWARGKMTRVFSHA